jgi:hypothetical protein
MPSSSVDASRLAQPISTVCVAPRLSKNRAGILLTTCRSKPANGFLNMTLTAGDGVTSTYIGKFVQGRMIGNFELNNQTVGYRYLGTLDGLSRGSGSTKYQDGSHEHGLYRQNIIYQGSVTKPGLYGQIITLTIEDGQQVGQSENEQIAEIEARFRPKHIVHMTKVRLEHGVCLADLPRHKFKIDADLPGRCINGYYNGKAVLELTPLGSRSKSMTVELNYDIGQIIGKSTVTYTGTKDIFVGVLANWEADQGELSSG